MAYGGYYVLSLSYQPSESVTCRSKIKKEPLTLSFVLK